MNANLVRPGAAPLPSSTKFFGRSLELDVLNASLSAARIVTVLGPPGAGKTRLVLEYLSGLAGDRPPALFCDLTPAQSRVEVQRIVLAALEIEEADPRETGARLASALVAAHDMLIVLDNAEHVLEHVASLVTAWVREAPSGRFLVTSRELLRCEGEAIVEVGPLAPREPNERSSEALELFLDRWRLARPGTLDEREVAAAADIVDALDPLPLVLELIAARGVALPLLELHARLRRGEEVVALAARRGASETQPTLEAAIEGSWRLLAPDEKLALMRCSVFRGGFGWGAAARIIADDAIGSGRAKALAIALREKSLLREVDAVGEGRVSLYEAVRELAARRLAEDPEAKVRADRAHRTTYLDLAEEQARMLDGPRGADALARLVLERHNIRSAFDCALGDPGADSMEQAARLALAFDPVFLLRGEIAQHEEMFRALEDGPRSGEISAASRVQIDAAAGSALRQAGRGPAATARLERARAAASESGDLLTEARCQRQLAWIASASGRVDEALTRVDVSLQCARRAGHLGAEVSALTARAAMGAMSGRPSALDDAERAVELSTSASTWHRAMASFVLGQALLVNGALAGAERAFLHALEGARRAADRPNEALALSNLGLIRQELGALALAAETLEDAVSLARRIGNRRIELYLLVSLGGVRLECRELDAAQHAFERALQIALPAAEHRSRAIAHGGLGIVFALGGALFEAARAFEKAGRLIAESDEPILRKLGETQAAQLWLAEARRAAGGGDAHAASKKRTAAVALSSLRRDPAGARLVLDELRVYQRLLSTAIASEAVVVAPSGASAQLPSGGFVDLERRPILGRLLVRLGKEHQSDPSASVSAAELFAAGWPGESAKEEAVANRIRVAMTQLRGAGLVGVEFRGGGYAFTKAVWVVLRDGG